MPRDTSDDPVRVELQVLEYLGQSGRNRFFDLNEFLKDRLGNDTLLAEGSPLHHLQPVVAYFHDNGRLAKPLRQSKFCRDLAVHSLLPAPIPYVLFPVHDKNDLFRHARSVLVVITQPDWRLAAEIIRTHVCQPGGGNTIKLVRFLSSQTDAAA